MSEKIKYIDSLFDNPYFLFKQGDMASMYAALKRRNDSSGLKYAELNGGGDYRNADQRFFGADSFPNSEAGQRYAQLGKYLRDTHGDGIGEIPTPPKVKSQMDEMREAQAASSAANKAYIAEHQARLDAMNKSFMDQISKTSTDFQSSMDSFKKQSDMTIGALDSSLSKQVDINAKQDAIRAQENSMLLLREKKRKASALGQVSATLLSSGQGFGDANRYLLGRNSLLGY